MYYDDSEAKKTSPSVGGGKKEGLSQIVKVAEDLKSSSMEIETEAKPRLVKVFPTKVSSQIKEETFNKMEVSHSQSSQVKKVQRKVKEDAWTFLPVLDSLQLPWMEKTYVHEGGKVTWFLYCLFVLLYICILKRFNYEFVIFQVKTVLKLTRN